MDRSPRNITPQLLVADEDQATGAFLQDNLIADGYQVDVAKTGILADVNGATLTLVDQVRNGEHGLCAASTDTPIIALTTCVDEVHRMRLLERGSDDVITKPFSYPELRARIDALLRRMTPRQPGAPLTAGPVRIDRRRRAVTVDQRAVHLRSLEYALLCALAAEPTRVFTRDELMSEIWGYTRGRTRTLDSPASRLRLKLANDTHRLVVNVWGVGSSKKLTALRVFAIPEHRPVCTGLKRLLTRSCRRRNVPLQIQLEVESPVQVCAPCRFSWKSKAPCRFAPRRFTPCSCVWIIHARWRLARCRSAISRSGPVSVAPCRFACCNCASGSFAFKRFAPCRFAPCRSAPRRSAPSRSAHRRSAFSRFVPRSIAACRFARLQVRPPAGSPAPGSPAAGSPAPGRPGRE